MNLPLPLDDPGDYEDPDDISEGERTSAPSEEQVGPGAFRGPGSTLIGGAGVAPPGGGGGGSCGQECPGLAREGSTPPVSGCPGSYGPVVASLGRCPEVPR